MSNDYCEGCSGDCDECGLNVPREGPIIKGGGVSKPDFWDEDQYAEYKMSAEYASECRHVGCDSDLDEWDDVCGGGPDVD